MCGGAISDHATRGHLRHANDYFFTTTSSGLSLAARLCTTSALPVVLALSLRARWTSSAGMIPASPALRRLLPLPSTSTIKLPSITCSNSWAPGCTCQGAAGREFDDTDDSFLNHLTLAFEIVAQDLGELRSRLFHRIVRERWSRHCQARQPKKLAANDWHRFLPLTFATA